MTSSRGLNLIISLSSPHVVGLSETPPLSLDSEQKFNNSFPFGIESVGFISSLQFGSVRRKSLNRKRNLPRLLENEEMREGGGAPLLGGIILKKLLHSRLPCGVLVVGAFRTVLMEYA